MDQTRAAEGAQLLRNVVTFLQGRDMAAKHVWAILTALRGPDTDCYNEEKDDLKSVTTARVRHALGLVGGEGNGIVVADQNPLNDDAAFPAGFDHSYGDYGDTVRKYIEEYEGISGHFIKHYSWAVRALIELGFMPQD